MDFPINDNLIFVYQDLERSQAPRTYRLACPCFYFPLGNQTSLTNTKMTAAVCSLATVRNRGSHDSAEASGFFPGCRQFCVGGLKLDTRMDFPLSGICGICRCNKNRDETTGVDDLNEHSHENYSEVSQPFVSPLAFWQVRPAQQQQAPVNIYFMASRIAPRFGSSELLLFLATTCNDSQNWK